MINKGLKGLLFVLLAVFMGACKKDNNGTSTRPPQYDKNYYGRQAFVIALNSLYQNYDSALKKTGLIDTLAAPGPYTSFLLDNTACTWGYTIPENANFVLSSLIISGDHPLGALPFGRNQRFTTLAGNHLYLSKVTAGTDSAAYIVNGVPVSAADISSTNGYINVIHNAIPNVEQYSSVLAYVQGSPDLTFLSLALKLTGQDKLLADTTRTWTLLAPADAAFKQSTDPDLNSYDGLLHADTAKLSRIVRYHILADRDFYTEFIQQLTNTDTVRITPILPNASIGFYFSSAYPLYGNYFIGPGNWSGDGTNPPVAKPAGIYQPSYGYFLSDFIAVNGVVHEIDNILLP